MTFEWPSRKREEWQNTDTKPARSLVLLPVVAEVDVESGPGVVVGELIDRGPIEGLGDAPLAQHAAQTHTRGVSIEARGACERPVRIALRHAGDGTFGTWSRIRIVARAGSAVTLLETHEGDHPGDSIVGVVTEIVAEPGSSVRYVQVQRSAPGAFHFGTVHARVERGASFESHVVSLGARTARSAVHVDLVGEGATCSLWGVYAAAGQQSLDHYTVIDHRVPHCTSRELYKGVVVDEAVGSFLGRILVAEGAVHSATEQMTRTLLLSERARCNARPQLEIDNDEVAATHGAAVGSLDADALFYLQARGIDPKTARALVVQGFVREILAALPIEGLGAELIGPLLARLHEGEIE